MQSNQVLNVVVFFIITLILPNNEAVNSIKVENIFPENVTVQSGDVMQCEILKTNILNETNKNNEVYVYTGNTIIYAPEKYQFHPISGKCFSFKVRSTGRAHIALTSIPSIDENRLEVVLEDDNYSCIRRTRRQLFPPIYDTVNFVKFFKKGIINNSEYKGFWIRMLDDQLLEVGHELEDKPFLSYKFPSRWLLNYFGFMSWKTTGAWIINGDSKCPGKTNEVTKNITSAESKCFMLT